MVMKRGPEVNNLQIFDKLAFFVIDHQNVLRLQIAVHNALTLESVQGEQHLRQKVPKKLCVLPEVEIKRIIGNLVNPLTLVKLALERVDQLAQRLAS